MSSSNPSTPSWWNRQADNYATVSSASVKISDSDRSLDIYEKSLVESPKPKLSKPSLSSRPALSRLHTGNFGLQWLIHPRQSHESNSTVTNSPESAASRYFSGSSNPSYGVKSPVTPELHQDVPAKKAAKTPISTPHEALRNNSAIAPISLSDLRQIWAHAIYLAHANRNQNATRLFTHLVSRPGVPAHLIPLLPLNAGLIMLKENHAFPALHIFDVTARNICPVGCLMALTTFLMGIAAWEIAATAPSNCTTTLAHTVCEEVYSDGAALTADDDFLRKARVYFSISLEEMGELDMLAYAALGLDWTLDRRIVVDNIIVCDRAMALRQIGEEAWASTRVAVHRLPDGMLFKPLECVSRTLGRHRSKSMRLVDYRLMKELPPLPTKQ